MPATSLPGSLHSFPGAAKTGHHNLVADTNMREACVLSRIWRPESEINVPRVALPPKAALPLRPRRSLTRGHINSVSASTFAWPPHACHLSLS